MTIGENAVVARPILGHSSLDITLELFNVAVVTREVRQGFLDLYDRGTSCNVDAMFCPVTDQFF